MPWSEILNRCGCRRRVDRIPPDPVRLSGLPLTSCGDEQVPVQRLNAISARSSSARCETFPSPSEKPARAATSARRPMRLTRWRTDCSASDMATRTAKRARPPSASGVEALRRAARRCRACPLWKPATQTVFGSGPDDASIMLIGEQAGDREDIEGLPFVGPAGRLLDQALGEVGIDRAALYVTNGIK